MVLWPTTGPHLAIESKFLEPYGSAAKGGLKGKYFDGPDAAVGHWNVRGLAQCQELAAKLYSAAKTYRLHAEQLLKHILGLRRTGEAWTLLYLWYEVGGDESKDHRSEVADFERCVWGDCIQFTALSYQELFTRLESKVGLEHGRYKEYMRGRYFKPTTESM